MFRINTHRKKISASVCGKVWMIAFVIVGYLGADYCYAQAAQNRPMSLEKWERSEFFRRVMPHKMPVQKIQQAEQRQANNALGNVNQREADQFTSEAENERSTIRWKQANGPETASITSILATGNTVMVTTTGGVFLSQDSGRSWRYAEQSPDTFLYDFVQVGEAIFTSGSLFGYTKGVYRSLDNGESWSVTSNGLPAGMPVGKLGSVGNTIVANVYPGFIYRSLDWGANWELASTGLPEGLLNARFANIGATLLLASSSDSHLFRSTDNAASWAPVALTLPANVKPIAVVASGNRFLVSTSGAGVFYSDDLGTSWQPLTNGISADAFINSLNAVGSSIYAIAVNGDLYESTNKGGAWELRLAGFASAKGIGNIVKAGNAILAATYDGVLRSTDHGRTWKSSNRGLRGAEVYRHEAIGKHWFVGTAGGGFWRSSDKGETWKQINNGISGTDFQGISSSGILADRRTLFAGTSLPGNDGNFLYRSDDLGETWTPVTAVNEFGAGLADLYKIGNNLYVAFFGGTIVSTDHGRTFQRVEGLPQDQWFDDLIKAGSSLFACSYGGGVFRSDDNGVHWQPMNDGLDQPNSVYANGITAFGGSLFLGTDEGLYRSDNHGYYWYFIGLPNQVGVNDVKSLGQTLFASTYGAGIFTSEDNGVTWTPTSRGLVGNRVFNFLRIGDRMAIGSSGHGVFLSNPIDY